MSSAAASALPGLLFLRPYAARHVQSTAAASAYSPLARTAYLRFYQTACGLQSSSGDRRRKHCLYAAPKRNGNMRRDTARPYGTKSSSTQNGSKDKDDDDEAATTHSEDRSAVALRVKELAEADALHYPRYQPVGDRVSVPQFRAEFNAVAVGDEAPHRRVELAGRVLSVQRLGAKLVFLKLLDEGEQVQVMCNLRQLREAETVKGGRGGGRGGDARPVEPSAFKNAVLLLNRGDHVAVTGRAMRTATGELTLAADVLPRVYAPALAPLPTRLLDADTRALRRHVDLLVNPAAAATLRLRARILREMRTFFENQHFVEVQTPILADLAGGAIARPFVTAHSDDATEGALSPAAGTSAGTSAGTRALSLRIAPELWLKRLVVGGFDRVFEIGPAFRNEGIDATHNPEFTTCEFYAAYWTLPRLMAETERLLAQLAQAALQFRETTPTGEGLLQAERDEQTNPTAAPAPSLDSIGRCAAGGPFAQLQFIPSLEAALGFTFPDLSAPDAYDRLREKLLAAASGVNSKNTNHQHDSGQANVVAASDSGSESRDDSFTGDADGGRLAKLLDRLAGEHLEPQSFSSAAAAHGGPLFITHHPACMSPLAKSFVCPRTGQRVAARAELFVDGRELANMYEEENDPAAQRRKMQQQVDETSDGGGPGPGGGNNAVDENYIAALESGLPPTGGWGCGVERLVMLFSGARRIADCLSFGTLRHVVAMAKK